jgi:large subunit ribosomal protein L21
MYAIIEAGGKQHRVTEGEKLRIDLLKGKKKGESLTFDRVLMLGGESYQVGQPLVSGATVTATVTDMGADGEGAKGTKIRVFKKKRRQGYVKTIGHRQRYTEVQINKING